MCLTQFPKVKEQTPNECARILTMSGNADYATIEVPDAIPRVNLAVVHVVLLSSVEDKFTLMGAIFL